MWFAGTPSDAKLLQQTCTIQSSLRATCATSPHTRLQRPFDHITLVAIYPYSILIPNFSERLWPRK